MPHSCGEILNNRYRIVKLLGQGGFGAVYRAWDMNLGKACALKQNLDTTPEAVRQFSREALILSNLTHPNLPRVTDHFFIPGEGQYLVMDFIEGDDLQEKLDHTQGPLPERQAVSWIVQVLDSLEYLHKQNPPVIHRDIKPLNIIITPEGKAVLVDFGIAKIYDLNLATTRGAQAVTPGYSPPEQYGHGKTDAMSDIYALGSTLYSLVTGMVPPASVDIVSGNALPPPSARECNPQVSQKTSSAIARAMQLNRLQRYPTAAEFKSALGKVPLVSPTPPPVQKAPAVTMPASRQAIRKVSPPWRMLWWLPVGVALLLAFLLQNLGFFLFSDLFWVILLGLAGLFFLSIFIQNKANWWSLTPGFTLLSIALLIALESLFPRVSDLLGGSIVLGGIGLSFLVIYLVDRKNLWAIIPAGVILTLTVVAGIDQLGPFDTGGLFFLGLGVTCALVAFLPNPKGPMRWAWIPAVMLALIGFLIMAASGDLIGWLWLLVLILGSSYMILRTIRPRGG